MTKTIDTLIEDMKEVLVNKVDSIPQELIDNFGKAMGEIVSSKLIKDTRVREPSLYFSNIGSPCERKLWYDLNSSEEREPFSADTLLKFMYGDVIELLVLFIAEVAGHKVEGTQTRAELHGVRGRRDAVIDGVVVDVKSTTSMSYRKFQYHELAQNDGFGYIPQLMGYLEAAREDPLVTDKSRAAFLAVDKTLGHFCLDFHEDPQWDWKAITDHKWAVVKAEEPPARDFEPVPEGKSGNMKLNTFCGYCSFKEKCHPGVRTFLYSKGPMYLTTVVKTPDVKEVTNGSQANESS